MRLKGWGGGLIGSLAMVLALAAPAHSGYGPQTSLGTGGFHAVQMVVADFNGDGRDDVAVAHDDPLLQGKPSVDVRLGTATGFDVSKKLLIDWGPQPAGIAVGQFGGPLGLPDTHTVDIGVVSAADGSIKFFNGNNDGTFTYMADAAGTGGVTPGAVASGDIDGDGITDIALGTDSGVRIVRGDGAFGITEAPGSPLALPAPVSAVRFKQLRDDEWSSLLIGLAPASAAVASTRLAVNDGGAFGNPTAIPGARVVDDIDSRTRADGSLDLLIVDHDYAGALTGSPALRLLNRPDSAAAPFTEVALTGVAVSAPSRARFVDANRDGVSDIAVTDGTAPAQVKVFHGAGPTTYAPAADSPFTLWSDPDTNFLELAHLFGTADDLLTAGSFYGIGGWTSSVRALRNRYASSVEAPSGPLTVEAETGKSATVQVPVSNGGDAPLTISGLGLAPADGPFTVDQDQCAAAIAPGATCQVDVVYAPVTAGDSSATLTIANGNRHASVIINGHATQGQTTTTTTTTTAPPTPGPTVPAPPTAPPVPSFKVTLADVQTSAQTNVTLSAEVLPAGRGYAYSWDLDGDGVYDLNSRQADTVVMQYAAAGTYKASVLVTRNSDGVQVPATGTVTVAAPQTFKDPKLPDTALAGRSIAVDITSANPSKVARYQYDWGDGVVPASSTVDGYVYDHLEVSDSGVRKHVYSKAGTYAATFTVMSHDGAARTIKHTIVVTGRAKRTAQARQADLQVLKGTLGTELVGTPTSDPTVAGYSVEQHVDLTVTKSPCGYELPVSEGAVAYPGQLQNILDRLGTPNENFSHELETFTFSTDAAKGISPALARQSYAEQVVGRKGTRAATSRSEQHFENEHQLNGYATFEYSDEPGKVYDRDHQFTDDVEDNYDTHVFHHAQTVTVTIRWHITDPTKCVLSGDNPNLDYVKQFKVVVRAPLCGSFVAAPGLLGKTSYMRCLPPTSIDNEFDNRNGIDVAGLHYSEGYLSGFATASGTRYPTISRGVIKGSISSRSTGGTVLVTSTVVFPNLQSKGTGDLITGPNLLAADEKTKAKLAVYAAWGVTPPNDIAKDTGATFEDMPVVDAEPITLRSVTLRGLRVVSSKTAVTVRMPDLFGLHTNQIRASEVSLAQTLLGLKATSRATHVSLRGDDIDLDKKQRTDACRSSPDDYIEPTSYGFSICIKQVPVIPGVVTANNLSLTSDQSRPGHSWIHGGGSVTINLGTGHGTLDAEERDVNGDEVGNHDRYGFSILDGTLDYFGAVLTGQFPVPPISFNKFGAFYSGSPDLYFKGIVGVGFPSGENIVTADACVQVQKIKPLQVVGLCLDEGESLSRDEVAKATNPIVPLSQKRGFQATQAETGVFIRGKVKVLGIPLGGGYVYILDRGANGWGLNVGGEAHFGVPFVYSADVHFDGIADYNPKGHPQIGGDKFAFQFDVGADTCLFTVLCLGGELLFNNRYLDVCAELFIVHLGASVDFKKGSIGVLGGLGGCDLGGSSHAITVGTRAAPFAPEVPTGMRAFNPGWHDEGDWRLQNTVDDEEIPIGGKRCHALYPSKNAESEALILYGKGRAPLAQLSFVDKAGKNITVKVSKLPVDEIGIDEGYGRFGFHLFGNDATIRLTRQGSDPWKKGKERSELKWDNPSGGQTSSYEVEGGAANTEVFVIDDPTSFFGVCVRNTTDSDDPGAPITKVVRADVYPPPYTVGAVTTFYDNQGNVHTKYNGKTVARAAKGARGASVVKFTARATLSMGESISYYSEDKNGSKQLIGTFVGPQPKGGEAALLQAAQTPQTMQKQKTFQKAFSFQPADDAVGKRTIYAYPTRFGRLLPRQKLGSYTAGKHTYRPPSRLKVNRTSSGGLKAAWLPALDASGYVVTVQRGSAKVTYRLPASRHTFTLKQASTLSAISVTVRAVNFRGEQTNGVVKRLKAAQKRSTAKITVAYGRKLKKAPKAVALVKVKSKA